MELFGLDYIFISHQRVFWLYLLSALFLASIYIYLFPQTLKEYKHRSIWWHKSAVMDYKYFILSSFIKVIFILPLILSSKDVALSTVLFLQDSLGYIQAINISKEIVVVLYTLSIFVVGDFSRYWLHRLLHTVPFLWRIHQVHHSAEVLNPLTFYRVHPVENILFGIRYALSVGLITGVFIYFFGAGIGFIQIIGANLFVFVFGMFGANLRHSHIPLRYGNLLEKIFISPYQHQLHHSKEFIHKNFGGALALWDWMFKTLHIEDTRVNIEYGIKEKSSHSTILEMLFEPFKIIKTRKIV
ncbi:MAG: sterol desaturase family protein [Campylobacterota bacterium]|nr:sterol desaturase family protein [Campylobacterota bacterium]